jgi:hypothetical protein
MANTSHNGPATVPAAQPLGKNVLGKIEGDRLILTIDLTQNFGPSSSGKSTIIATTSGNVAIPGTDAKLGLNLYK